MDEQELSAPQADGLSQQAAEPKVSALRASIPSAAWWIIGVCALFASYERGYDAGRQHGATQTFAAIMCIEGRMAGDTYPADAQRYCAKLGTPIARGMPIREDPKGLRPKAGSPVRAANAPKE